MKIKNILAAVLCLIIVSVSIVSPINSANAVATPGKWKVTYDDADINGDGTIKVLLIGNSYGLNLHEHMEKFLSQQERPVLLGDLYSSGATIGDYYISGRNGILYYHSANTTKPATVNSITYQDAVKAQNWDIIMIQSGVSAAIDDDTFKACLQPLVDTVRDTFEGKWGAESDYSLAWYFTWSRPTPDFCNNVEDYRNMVRVVRTYVEASNEFDVIMPAGTLIQNMRTADFSNYGTGEKKNDGICSDGAHADSEFACYALGYLYYQTLGLEGDPQIFSEAGGRYLNINRNAIIKECTQNALENPQEITESRYKVPLSERCTTGGAHALEVASVKQPTCITAGYTTMQCTVCGYKYNTNELDALGHDYDVDEKAATCTENGYINRACKNCTSTIKDTIPAGHDFTDKEFKRESDTGASSIYTQSCNTCGITRQSEEQTFSWDFNCAYGPTDYNEIKSMGQVYLAKSKFGGFDATYLGLLADGKLAFSTYGKGTSTGRTANYVQGVDISDTRQSSNTVSVPVGFSMNAGFYSEAENTSVAMVHSGVLLAKDENGYYSFIPSLFSNGTLCTYFLYSPLRSVNDDGTVLVSSGTNDKILSANPVKFYSAMIDGDELDFSTTSGTTYGATGNIRGYIDNLITLGIVGQEDAIPSKTTIAEQSKLSIEYKAVNEGGVITLNICFNYKLSNGSVLTLIAYPLVVESSGFTFNNDSKKSYSCNNYTSKTHGGFTAAFGPVYFTSVSYAVDGYATVDRMSITFLHTSDTTGCEHANTYVSGGYSATCLKAGRGDDTICADCGTIVTAGQAIAKAKHTPEESTVIAATCVSDGGVQEFCSTCETTYLSQVYGKTGHTFELTESVKATCTAKGYSRWKCASCKYEKYEEYAAAGHNFTEFIVEKMPTTQQDGLRYIECRNCSAKYTEIVPSIDLLDNAGDVNGDGVTNITDAILIARYSSGLSELSDYRVYIADVNADTRANVSDAVLIARFSSGLMDEFATGTSGR